MAAPGSAGAGESRSACNTRPVRLSRHNRHVDSYESRRRPPRGVRAPTLWERYHWLYRAETGELSPENDSARLRLKSRPAFPASTPRQPLDPTQCDAGRGRAMAP